MSGLTLSVGGAAEISDEDKRELVEMIRATVQRIEDLYRPVRPFMSSDATLTDPVLLGLYGAKDHLIEAEGSLLEIDLRDPKRSKGGGSLSA